MGEGIPELSVIECTFVTEKKPSNVCQIGTVRGKENLAFQSFTPIFVIH